MMARTGTTAALVTLTVIRHVGVIRKAAAVVTVPGIRHVAVIAALLAGGLAACARPAGAPADEPPARIIDQHSGAALDEAALIRRVLAAQVVLLGEVHDNPAHHAIRARLLRALAAAGPLTVVFEQFDREHQPQLDAWARPGRPRAARADATATAAELDGLLDAGGFDRKGWHWPLHAPLLQAALAPGVRIVAGNLSRDAARAVIRQGAAAIPPDLQAVITAARWDAGADVLLDQDLQQGHCGMLPAAALPGMARAQRVRDAALAEALRDPASPAPQRRVLIAGNGHVRRDFGVPRYLAGWAEPVLAIGFLEDDEAGPGPAGDAGGVTDRAAAATPAQPHGALTPRFDVVVTTRPAARDDPCAGFTPPAAPAPLVPEAKSARPAWPGTGRPAA
jgi:uncharacterized iron-regulated protein